MTPAACNKGSLLEHVEAGAALILELDRAAREDAAATCERAAA